MIIHYLIRLLMLAVFILSCVDIVVLLHRRGIALPFIGTIVRLPSGGIAIVAVNPPPKAIEAAPTIARLLIAVAVIWLVLSWADNSWQGALGLLTTAALMGWVVWRDGKQGNP